MALLRNLLPAARPSSAPEPPSGGSLLEGLDYWRVAESIVRNPAAAILAQCNIARGSFCEIVRAK